MLAHVWNSEDSTYKSRQLVSFLWPHLMAWGYFPGGLAVKNPPALPETRRLSFNPWVRKIHWRRKWQPTPVFLPRESHGQRSLVGFCPWGHKVQRVTEFPHQGSKSHPLQWKCRVLTSGQHWKSLFYFIFFFFKTTEYGQWELTFLQKNTWESINSFCLLQAGHRLPCHGTSSDPLHSFLTHSALGCIKYRPFL